MVHVHCVFKKCGNQRRKNGRISYFSFPKDEKLLQKWIDFVNNYNPTKLDEKNLDREKMKVCHLHFEKRQVQTKSNNDRVLVRNSVPRCPPGIIDKAHVLKKLKSKKKSKKRKQLIPDDNNADSEGAQNEPKDLQATVEGGPLYHTISGYVVDLRIAAQQDTFRLPNGKLIQVRRQPKKSSTAATELPVKPNNRASVPRTANNTETETLVKSNSVGNVSVRKDWDWQPTRPSKTYINRRTLNKSPRPVTPICAAVESNPAEPASAESNPAEPASAESTSTVTPQAPPVIDTNPTQSTLHVPIAPPSLASIQALIHKTHPETPFGTHMKEFESRLISTAELSLHMLSKINRFLHSNPYRNAENTGNLKDLYHHVAYILKYAMDRIKGLEESCAQDIQQMGFTKQSDLGPLIAKEVDVAPSKPSDIVETEETEKEAEDDDDCAIIEQRTDVIEVDSDDDEYESGDDSDELTIEPTSITLNSAQISSETESIGQNEGSNDSLQIEKHRIKVNREKQDAQVVLAENKEDKVDEVEKIEVTMNEVVETVVHDYYFDELSDDDDDDDGNASKLNLTNLVDGEIIDLYNDEASNEQTSPEDEEETEELIEIIEGDIDIDMDDGLEYKVIEIVDGDSEMWES